MRIKAKIAVATTGGEKAGETNEVAACDCGNMSEGDEHRREAEAAGERIWKLQGIGSASKINEK